jgi:hypothetical protein
MSRRLLVNCGRRYTAVASLRPLLCLTSHPSNLSLNCLLSSALRALGRTNWMVEDMMGPTSCDEGSESRKVLGLG